MSRRRMCVRKYILWMLAVVMLAVMAPSGRVMAEEPKAADTDDKEQESEKEQEPKIISVTSKGNKVPTYKAGEKQKWTFIVRNNTDKTVENIVVKPKLGEKASEWPFKTEKQDYSKKISKLEAKGTEKITFEFTQRENVSTKRYTLEFTFSAKGMEDHTQKFYVNTTAKKKDQEDDNENPGGNPGGDGTDDPGDGGIDNGDPYYDDGGDGGDGSESESVPRVIVTGFSTNPSEVRAGKDFTLTVHLKNTSKTAAVKNMLFDLNASTEGEDEQSSGPAFLPSSGSSSVYLDGIGADGTADISINLNAKADLFQKPYSLELAMKYEDNNGSQVDSSSNLSIPVKQNVRFEFSKFEINPVSISVGEEANVMCSLYNLGRVKLYNVKAIFEGDCIEPSEVFLGNIESGATASIDAMLMGSQMSEGPGSVTMTLSYEDESGKTSKKKEELELEVMEAMDDDMMAMEEFMEEDPEEGSKFPIIPIVAVVIIVIVAAVIFIVKRRKKKRLENEEEALLNELDGPSEDEWK